MQEFYMRLVRLPLSVEAAVLPNDDGTFDIYVNERLPEERRRLAFDHEVRHIRLDHLYNCEPVCVNELEADGKRVPHTPPPAPPVIPAPVAPTARPPRRELRLPTVSPRERAAVAALSRRLDAEWARDPMGMLARLEDKWLFNIR